MVSKKYTVKNELGLHMRPAGVITNAMMKFNCDVNLFVNGRPVNAKSILNVMAACIKCGTKIELICDGTQEKEAVEKFDELYNNNFGD